MNTTTRNVALLGLISALALGLIAAVGISPSTYAVLGSSDNVIEKSGFLGHITITVTDPEGNIVQYLQTDNTVVNDGENCANELLFGATNTNCPSTAGLFNDISWGTGSTTGTVIVTDLSVFKEKLAAASVIATGTAIGIGDNSAQTTLSASTVLLQISTVTEAALIEGTNDDMFAYQVEP